MLSTTKLQGNWTAFSVAYFSNQKSQRILKKPILSWKKLQSKQLQPFRFKKLPMQLLHKFLRKGLHFWYFHEANIFFLLFISLKQPRPRYKQETWLKPYDTKALNGLMLLGKPNLHSSNLFFMFQPSRWVGYWINSKSNLFTFRFSGKFSFKTFGLTSFSFSFTLPLLFFCPRWPEENGKSENN